MEDLPTIEELRQQIRGLGLRATGARLAVLRVLSGQASPTSHPEIVAALASDGWDRATLYRNLVDLTEVGLLRRVDHGDHVWRYELADRAHGSEDHPHFLCTVCGDVSCLPELELELSAEELPAAVRSGNVAIQLRGTCDGCAGDLG
ncbi:MAG TPA: transcriptional repressor [Deltaproteobacteria bacterium]|nr:transcriptional repressor [Deltaproteobacteria bacterium]